MLPEGGWKAVNMDSRGRKEGWERTEEGIEIKMDRTRGCWRKRRLGGGRHSQQVIQLRKERKVRHHCDQAGRTGGRWCKRRLQEGRQGQHSVQVRKEGSVWGRKSVGLHFSILSCGGGGGGLCILPSSPVCPSVGFLCKDR